eukprot:3986360-Amphidinium_carterae.1
MKQHMGGTSNECTSRAHAQKNMRLEEGLRERQRAYGMSHTDRDTLSSLNCALQACPGKGTLLHGQSMTITALQSSSEAARASLA